MTGPIVPLPDDDDLTEKELKILKGIPDANIFRGVANTSASLKPFLEFAASILFQSKFDRKLRELAVLRIAQVTQAPYEWTQHVRIGKIVGLTDEDIARVTTDGPVTGFEDPDVRLVLEAAEDITRNVRLSDDLLQALLNRFDTQQTTEFILCVSYFNMVSRFVESMRIPLEDSPIL